MATITVYGKNAPASANYWVLTMRILTPYGQSILASYIGSPSELVCDPEHLEDPTWSIEGNVFTEVFSSMTWASWPAYYGEMASSYWGPPDAQGPIQLIGELVDGGEYEFDHSTGVMKQPSEPEPEPEPEPGTASLILWIAGAPAKTHWAPWVWQPGMEGWQYIGRTDRWLKTSENVKVEGLNLAYDVWFYAQTELDWEYTRYGPWALTDWEDGEDYRINIEKACIEPGKGLVVGGIPLVPILLGGGALATVVLVAKK